VAGWSVDGTAIANWFFAAPKASECLRQSITQLATRAAAAQQVGMDASTLGDAEISVVTGEGAFTQALLQCKGERAPAVVAASKLHAALTHLNASTSWKASTGYLPWHLVREGTAPRKVLSVWRTSWLPTKGPIGEASAAWSGAKSSIAAKRTVHDDGTCRDVFLGNVFSGWIDLLDRLPLNVMRARMCALTGTVINGGIYMDLDVVPGSSEGAAELEWASAPRGQPLFGWAEEGVVAPWFFAAAAWDPVLRCVLWRTVEALERAETTYEAGWAGYETPEALVGVVENTTGAAGFTRAVLGCGGKPRLSAEEMGGGLLRHLGASRAWAKQSPSAAASPHAYRSWRVEARQPATRRAAALVVDSAASGEEALRRAFERTNPGWKVTVFGANDLQGGAVPHECPGTMGKAARLFCAALLAVSGAGGGVVYGARGIDLANAESVEPMTAAAALRGSGLHLYTAPGAGRGAEIAGAVAVVHPDSKSLECAAAFAARLGSWDEAATGLTSVVPTCAQVDSLVTLPSVSGEWA
jgi:hypothetical protein